MTLLKIVVNHLLSVLFIFNGINSTTGLGSQSEVKLGIFTEPTSIAEERVFLIIVNSSIENKRTIVRTLYFYPRNMTINLHNINKNKKKIISARKFSSSFIYF